MRLPLANSLSKYTRYKVTQKYTKLLIFFFYQSSISKEYIKNIYFKRGYILRLVSEITLKIYTLFVYYIIWCVEEVAIII